MLSAALLVIVLFMMISNNFAWLGLETIQFICVVRRGLFPSLLHSLFVLVFYSRYMRCADIVISFNWREKGVIEVRK